MKEGVPMNYYQATYSSPIGEITMISNDHALVGLWIEGQNYTLKKFQNIIMKKEETEVLKQTKKWLNSYFKGNKMNIKDLNMEFSGTCFQQKVWQILKEIPYGTTITYGCIAKKLIQEGYKKRMSAQAVGGAVSRNPIAIIIPCHRVLGVNQKLTGYAGGIDKKIALLKIEGILIDEKNR